MIAKVNTKLKVCKFCYSFNYPMKWTKRDFCRLISQGLEVPLSTFMLAYFRARFKYIYWNPAKFMFFYILVPFGRRSKGIECHPGSQIHKSLCQKLDSKLLWFFYVILPSSPGDFFALFCKMDYISPRYHRKKGNLFDTYYSD